MPIPENVENLRRVSAKSSIYQVVCSWIITGVLKPGEKIVDSELAKRFNVSRTPVREAIQILEGQKLVYVVPGRATVVADIDPADIEKCYRTLAELQGLAAELACGSLTDRELEQLERIHAAFVDACGRNDGTDAITQDSLFHDAIVRGAHNEYVEEFSHTMILHIQRIKYHYFHCDRLRKISVSQHGEILQTIQARDSARAKELIETQLGNSAQMRAIGAKPIKGVIFTGAPGTGKTHLARIIANVADAQFYLVSGPTIVSKYVGDSEETLRMIFAAAQSDKRAIIFFDEIDSIASSRETDTNGVGKRLVAQLLTLMDGFESKGNVVVVAATNRLEDVDPALLRPGRFDWQIPFPMPSEHDRLRILQVQAASLSCEGELPLTDVAERTEGWSGAEVCAIWTEAALVAAKDKRAAIRAGDLMTAFERVEHRPEFRARRH